MVSLLGGGKGKHMLKMMTSLIEDKRINKAQRVHTHRNPERHMPLVSLLLWHKMVATRCFVWPPALRLWSSRHKNSSFSDFKKFYIWLCASVFLFLMLYLMLDGLLLFRKGDFSSWMFFR